MPNIDIHAIRLKPGADLRKSIQEYADLHKITAAWVITCVGSLTNYHIRFANQQEGNRGEGFFEIICLSGTISLHGSHMHIGIGDEKGHLVGGHLLEGCIIYTTAEIIIQCTDDLVFKRENDQSTPWNELCIIKAAGK